MNDHVLGERIAFARVISSNIDWRDLDINDRLRTFIIEILNMRGLEGIVSEQFVDDLELLLVYAEVHNLSYRNQMHPDSFALLKSYIDGSEK